MQTYLPPALRCLAAGIIALAGVTSGNNLTIGNLSLDDAGAGQVEIQFDMNWDNSWHETWTESGGTISITNWDAVWVFAKYRQNGGLWRHVMLAPDSHTATGGTVIEVADDGDGRRLGAFVHRSAAGSGTTTCTAMRLRWDLAAAGIPSAEDLDITVMGIEMVHIPGGAFRVGSGGTESNHFHEDGDADAPFRIESEAALAVGTGPGSLQATGALVQQEVPAGFPKGHAAFYCMKYEVSEGQYVDFLNLLDPGISANYFPNATNFRHTIQQAAGGGYETAAEDRACNYLKGSFLLPYLDWCGLRPMTELEFEKACRGARAPWVDEYAWGNTTAVPLEGFDGSDGSGTETALPATANCHINNSPVSGPSRVGIFAGAATTREQSGASYYGVMELSGSLYEPCVVLYRAEGLAFTDVYGDGNEYTPVTEHWPDPSSYAYGLRGGSYNYDGATTSRVSNRGQVVSRYRDASPHFGGRGVRTEP